MWRLNWRAVLCLGAPVLIISSPPGFAQTTNAPSLAVRIPDRGSLEVSWMPTNSSVVLEQTDTLGGGVLWQTVTQTPQPQGNSLVVSLSPSGPSRFFRLRVLSGTTDADADGIPDSLEPALGLNPNKADTDGDGILDGDEDLDGDHLRTSWEIRFGLDPLKADTDGNGINDDLEDSDNDGLANLAEQQHGTNPGAADSDNDGWDDNGEVIDGSDPASASSTPKVLVASVTVTFLNAVPETLPPGTQLEPVSVTASFLNAVPQTAPPGLTVDLASGLVSILNAAPEAYLGPFFLASPIVSYNNQ